MRLTVAGSVTGGLLAVAQQSSCQKMLALIWCDTDRVSDRFYGFKENKREEEKDMREMVEKVKKGEPLYGKSTLTPYMQGVASRNSRYAGTFFYMIPWFNFVNHEHVSPPTLPLFLSTKFSSARCRYCKILSASRAGTRG